MNTRLCKSLTVVMSLLMLSAAIAAAADSVEAQAKKVDEKYQAGARAFESGRYAEAGKLLTEALAEAETLPCEESGLSRCLHLLACALQYEHIYKESEALFVRELAIQDRMTCQDSADISRALNSLAALYMEIGQLAKAEERLKRAVAIVGHDPNGNPALQRNRIVSLTNLGAVYASRGQADEAEEQFQQALRAALEAKQRPDLTSLYALDQLAAFYYSQRNLRNVKLVTEFTLKIKTKFYGRTHYCTASSLNALASVEYENKQYRHAERLLLLAKRILDDSGRLHDPIYCEVLNNISAVYNMLEDYDAARRSLTEAVKLTEGKNAEPSQSLIVYLENLVSVCVGYKKYADAKSFGYRALSAGEQLYGENSSRCVPLLNDLALVEILLGQFDEAEVHAHRSLEIGEKLLGEKDAQIARSLDALADVERHRLQLHKAELLLKRALLVYEQGDDSDYSAMARDLELLTGIFVDQGHYGDAEESIERLRMILKNHCPQDIDGMFRALELHAKLLRKVDRIAEAEKVEEDTRALHEKHGKPRDTTGTARDRTSSAPHIQWTKLGLLEICWGRRSTLASVRFLMPPFCLGMSGQ